MDKPLDSQNTMSPEAGPDAAAAARARRRPAWVTRRLGYDSREEVFQLRSSDFYADPEFRQELIRLLRENGIVPATEAVLQRKDGSILHALGQAVLLVNEQADIEVVGQVSNGQEAVEQADRLRPDVVVMDVAMSAMRGDEATRRIKQDLPRTRVVGLSMFDDPAAVEKMHRAGAARYMLKTAPSEELLAAVRGHEPDT